MSSLSMQNFGLKALFSALKDKAGWPFWPQKLLLIYNNWKTIWLTSFKLCVCVSLGDGYIKLHFQPWP